MIEECKPIQHLGFENYLVHPMGFVWSIKKGDKARRILRNGYYCVYLCHRGSHRKKKWFRISRLVAECFIPNPDKKPCVNHIDGNKNNDDIANLEWVTYKENSQHAIRIGLTVFKSGSTDAHKSAGIRNRGINNKFSMAVFCGETGEVFGSISEAGRVTKQNPCIISWKIRGMLGYKNHEQWRYATEEEINKLKNNLT